MIEGRLRTVSVWTNFLVDSEDARRTYRPHFGQQRTHYDLNDELYYTAVPPHEKKALPTRNMCYRDSWALKFSQAGRKYRTVTSQQSHEKFHATPGTP